MKHLMIIVFALCLLLIVGCQTVDTAPTIAIPNESGQAGDSSTPVAVSSPTASQGEGASLETAVATASPLISSSTPTPVTTTPAPPTPETAGSQLPEGVIGAPFPDNVNPLTGEQVSDPSQLNRRPVAIKISNYPAAVRPQSGLNSADLLFEHYAEGGVTRFTAVFYTNDASPIGSIRSGRIIDLEIPKMYDAAFAYSGASGPVRLMMRDSIFFPRIISPDFGHGGFYRVEDPNKAFEHTLFTDTPRLRAILDERGENSRPEFTSNMVFSPEPPAGGTAASTIEVGYTGTNVYWSYDSALGEYLRWTDGQPHTDANTGAQLSFNNVIVLAANHVETDILEDLVGGGHYSIQIQVWGEGPVSIFRDGQRFEGHWQREDESDMLTFYDSDGNPLPLKPGNSFFQLVPLGFSRLSVGG